MPTEPSHDPVFRVIDLAAKTKRLWGIEWNKPEVSYEFSGRKFELRTGDAAIYSTSPDF